MISWLSRTDPSDVARVESLTYISAENQRDTIPIPKSGVKGALGIENNYFIQLLFNFY